jgi:hypothetical protein
VHRGFLSVGKRKVMSRLLQKNKPVAYAASQDFINAILCDGLLILSNLHVWYFT